jgi:hypothetical protein
VRKLGVLIEHLPAESATMTALRNERGDEADEQIVSSDAARAPWSPVEMLLATVVDELRNLQSVMITTATGKAQKPPPPIRRPGVGAKSAQPRPRMTPDKRALLDAQRRALSPHLQPVPDPPEGGG